MTAPARTRVITRQPKWVTREAIAGRKTSWPAALAAVSRPTTNPSRARNQRPAIYAARNPPTKPVDKPTAMVGDVGRTELAEDAASGARTLFGSLRRLKALLDHIEVLPGAYSGSVCGRRLSG